jgi:hypothetical protein
MYLFNTPAISSLVGLGLRGFRTRFDRDWVMDANPTFRPALT